MFTAPKSKEKQRDPGYSPEIALICAIVERAMADLVWKGKPSYDKDGDFSAAYKTRIMSRNDAYEWFFNEAMGFPFIAEILDLDISGVQRVMKERILARCCGYPFEV